MVANLDRVDLSFVAAMDSLLDLFGDLKLLGFRDGSLSTGSLDATQYLLALKGNPTAVLLDDHEASGLLHPLI
jgi:hypothetical protein